MEGDEKGGGGKRVREIYKGVSGWRGGGEVVGCRHVSLSRECVEGRRARREGERATACLLCSAPSCHNTAIHHD